MGIPPGGDRHAAYEAAGLRTWGDFGVRALSLGVRCEISNHEMSPHSGYSESSTACSGSAGTQIVGEISLISRVANVTTPPARNRFAVWVTLGACPHRADLWRYLCPSPLSPGDRAIRLSDRLPKNTAWASEIGFNLNSFRPNGPLGYVAGGNGCRAERDTGPTGGQ